MMKILIASQNSHKIDEIKPLLEKAGFEVTDARSHDLPEPPEDADTFLENARTKAKAAVEATGMAVLADDSGLVVEALGEFPGVHSKPYMETHGSYSKAVDDLFARLNGKPSDCYYYALLIVLFPDGREIIADGKIEGRLIRDRRGDGMFGFDPWFEIKSNGKTAAELTKEEKNQVSHRGFALRDLVEKLKQL